MKNEYMIKELARLYGVGTDTLRYYERLGLIRPRRGENGFECCGRWRRPRENAARLT